MSQEAPSNVHIPWSFENRELRILGVTVCFDNIWQERSTGALRIVTWHCRSGKVNLRIVLIKTISWSQKWEDECPEKNRKGSMGCCTGSRKKHHLRLLKKAGKERNKGKHCATDVQKVVDDSTMNLTGEKRGTGLNWHRIPSVSVKQKKKGFRRTLRDKAITQKSVSIIHSPRKVDTQCHG